MKKKLSKKIVFLDRDGVINKKADEHCYILKVEDFVFNDGIFEVVSKLQNEGFEFVVITNQRGISRGLISEDELYEIHQFMKNEFYKNGIEMLDIFYCPHGSDSCDCRKPKDGMLRQACSKYEIDLPNSILISDSRDDVEMGIKFGIGKNIFVESDKIKDVNIK